MDITFKTDEGRFNYRVCAIMINENRLLAMHDERSPYFYLPGGRVNLHETAEYAVLREVMEELEIDAEIVRPLWFNQSFFIEDVNNERYHELCLYYEYLYPLFIKDKIYDLPNELTMVTEIM